MTNKIPLIKVKKQIKKISNRDPNIRDIVCLIGGFETKIDEDHNTAIDAPVFVESYTEAVALLQDGSESTLPDANKALKQIFTEDISGALIVNISTFTESSGTKTWSRSLTATKLENALASINDIEFDILYVTEDLTDAFITTIQGFQDDRFEDKKPFDWVAVGTRNSKALYTTTAGKFGDGTAFLTQPLEINSTLLSLVESGAWLTNYIAKLPVANSLTAKTLEGVTGVGTVYDENTTVKLSELVGLGYFVVRNVNPLEGTYECVNSAGCNGLDLYINRCTNYIVNDFALRPYLGEHNNTATLSGIETQCNNLLNKFKNDLKAVENITYAVEKKTSDKVDVILNTIEFAGVITEIDVYITIEVV